VNRFLAATILILLGPVQSALALEPGSVLRVSESQRYCASSKQCTLVYTRCDSCDCGVAINESFVAAHNANLEALCAHHDTGRCEKICPLAKPMCVVGLCIMLPHVSL